MSKALGEHSTMLVPLHAQRDHKPSEPSKRRLRSSHSATEVGLVVGTIVFCHSPWSYGEMPIAKLSMFGPRRDPYAGGPSLQVATAGTFPAGPAYAAAHRSLPSIKTFNGVRHHSTTGQTWGKRTRIKSKTSEIPRWSSP